MNNGFPGSFTPMPNNMGLSCQPNFNGSQPGPCVLHHVNTGSVPVSNISRNVASVQNNQMDFRRVAQAQERHAMARFSQQQNSQIAAAKSITAMVARAAAEAAAKPAPKAAAKPAAKPVPKAAVKPAAKPVPKAAATPAAKPVPKAAATPAAKPVPKAVATPAAKPVPKAAAKPAAKPVPKAAATPAAKPVPKVVATLAAKPAPKIAEKPVAKPVSDVTPMLKTAANSANQNSQIFLDSSSAASVVNINNPKINNQTSTNLSAKSPKTINKTGNPLTLAVGYNFLSHTQLVLKDKELAECQTELCKIGKEAKWVATDLAQGISFGAGMIAGIPAGISDAVDGIVKMASSPAETFQALKSLGNSDNVLGNVSNAFKESWANSIDQMEAEFQKGGVSGAFNAGAEGGKIASDVLANFTGIAGVAKTGTVLTEKLAVKVAGKVELAAKAGGDITKVGSAVGSKGVQPAYTGLVIPDSLEMALPGGQKVWVQGNSSEYMAGSVVAKAITHTPEAAKLASQEKLRNLQFAANPAVENSSQGNVLIEGWKVAVPRPVKVAEQLLDIGIKANIAGLTAVVIKDSADRISSDGREQFINQGVTGNNGITTKNLSSLQDKYIPSHTGNNQIPDTALKNTDGNQQLTPQTPIHTGNNQIPGQGTTHTGNTEGVTNSGIKTTITPIPDRPNIDDLAYQAGGYEPNKGSVGNMGVFFGQQGFGSQMKEYAHKTGQIYDGQSVYQAKGDVGDYIIKDDKYYLDGFHKNHIEVFDKNRNIKAVMNLDGSLNRSKTDKAFAEGRTLPK